MRAIKKESKVVIRDWVDNQACSLLQNSNFITNLFIMGNILINWAENFNKANNFLKFTP